MVTRVRTNEVTMIAIKVLYLSCAWYITLRTIRQQFHTVNVLFDFSRRY